MLHILSILLFSFLFFIVFSIMLNGINDSKYEYGKNIILVGFSLVFSIMLWLFLQDSNQSCNKERDTLIREIKEKNESSTEELIEKSQDKAIEATIYELNEKLRDDCFELIYKKRQPTTVEKKLCEESIFFIPNIESTVKKTL